MSSESVAVKGECCRDVRTRSRRQENESRRKKEKSGEEKQKGRRRETNTLYGCSPMPFSGPGGRYGIGSAAGVGLACTAGKVGLGSGVRPAICRSRNDFAGTEQQNWSLKEFQEYIRL
ncbi:hypothetical protein B0H14DRAFT_2579325 [Mycena olivaceomarginata]|nr:hypothetical protein B0H14DRAFT_2579325 [Mycena olivaceomarginata]